MRMPLPAWEISRPKKYDQSFFQDFQILSLCSLNIWPCFCKLGKFLLKYKLYGNDFPNNEFKNRFITESFLAVPENAKADAKSEVYRVVFRTLPNVYDGIFVATIFNG